jgi:L-amino acid N-acyltransferase YncA
MDIQFNVIRREDIPSVLEIYNWYILNSTATFHTSPVGENEVSDFLYIDHVRYRSYTLTADKRLVGYCFLTPHKKRQAYDRTAEVTIYLHPDHCKKGIGKVALEFLERVAREVGFKNLIGVVTGDNTESVRLFQRMGYMKCAHFKNVGEKFNKVLDVVAFQKELE